MLVNFTELCPDCESMEYLRKRDKLFLERQKNIDKRMAEIRFDKYLVIGIWTIPIILIVVSMFTCCIN